MQCLAAGLLALHPPRSTSPRSGMTVCLSTCLPVPAPLNSIRASERHAHPVERFRERGDPGRKVTTGPETLWVRAQCDPGHTPCPYTRLEAIEAATHSNDVMMRA